MSDFPTVKASPPLLLIDPNEVTNSKAFSPDQNVRTIIIQTYMDNKRVK